MLLPDAHTLIARLLADATARDDVDMVSDCRVALGLDEGSAAERQVAELLCEFHAVCLESGIDPVSLCAELCSADVIQ